MIVFDPTTVLGIAPVALTALLGLLVVIVDLAWPERPTLITGFAAVGVLGIMALTIALGIFPNLLLDLFGPPVQTVLQAVGPVSQLALR